MSPFDKARYARLLKGLEVTVLPYSEAIAADSTGRLDSSFFEKRFIDLRKLAGTWERLDAHAKSVICGPFGSNLLNENYVEHGIPMIRPFNLRNCRADRGEIALLEESFVIDAGLKTFPPGTVMFARVGEIGAGINLYERASISPNIIAAELLETINPYFVSVFANTIYGRTQLEAGMKVVAQPTISTDSIRALRIPPLGKAFQQKIAETFKQAVLSENSSRQLLTQAETALMNTLSLEGWQAPEALSYVRNSGQAFAAERFDAEYFHPAKTAALAKLGALSDCTVGDLFSPVRKLWQPNDDSGPDAVRNYDLTDALSPFLDGSKEPSARTTIASTKKTICAGDLVVSRLRSYLKEIALVQSGGDVPMVASTEYIVLRPKQSGGFPVEALMIFLRSALPQTVFKWSQDGSNHPRFDEKELLRLPVPRVLIQQSKDYVAAVRAAISKRERATKLLEAAKRAVEIAIVEDEESALAYLICPLVAPSHPLA